MKFGPQRGHFLFIFEQFFVTFGLLILLLAFFIITGEWRMMTNYIYLPVAAVIGPVVKVLDYLFTYYSISDEALFIKKGIFKKKNTEVPLSTITNVDYSQGLILQLAHAYSITVDTTATISADNKTKIKLTLKKEDADQVKALLLAHKYGIKPAEELPEEDEKIISVTHASPMEIMLMGLMEAKMVVLVQLFSVLAVIITFGSILFMGREIDGEQFIMNQFLQLSGFAIAATAAVTFYILGFIVGVLKSMLKYYGFRITNREDSIFIEYGLITRKTHTLLKEKISGVEFRQPFLMRIFNCGVVHVFAVGYGNNPEEGDVASILFPYLKAPAFEGFVAHHFPDLPEEGELQKATKRSLRYFFITPRLFVGIYLMIMGIGANFLPAADFDMTSFIFDIGWILSIVIFILIVISILLEYKNTGIYSTGRCTFLTSGGYTRKHTLLYTHMIESLTGAGSVFKRRKGIATIILGTWGSKMNASHKVRNLEMSALEHLQTHLTY